MKLLISGNSALLTIDVISYERPNATEFYDSNWLRCKVSCQIGSLRITEDMSLQTSDFLLLQESISAFKQHRVCEIKFVTLEEQLQFTIQREQSTHIKIKGAISAIPPSSGIFTFEFEAEALSDSTIESLEDITLNFPVRIENEKPR